jgi:hypothetical protein
MFFQTFIEYKIKWTLCELQGHKGSEVMTLLILNFRTTWGGWLALLLSLPILTEKWSRAL